MSTLCSQREQLLPEQLPETNRSELKSSSSVPPSVLLTWTEPKNWWYQIFSCFWRLVMLCWKIITVDESFQQCPENMITDLSLKVIQ